MIKLFSAQGSSIIIDVFSFMVPFFLGLFSSMITDNIKESKKKKRNKVFIKSYLRNTILAELPKIELAFQDIKFSIENYSDEYFKLPVFEGFNSNVLKGIEPVEYFDTFKKKYTILNEIISTIDFLSSNLPMKINDDYYDKINDHLKEQNKIGDLEHEKSCNFCIDVKNRTLAIIEIRLNEIQELNKKIEAILK
ncbi:hypothetical protein [Flavobacterium sp. UMI-01]|uniref:hypothetical protein n=1 Tax=Flavobacterium sp. UMI-01 TaxID=1441053 RepID=UPI001C7D776E|nr:hypothetical protein [Flavobacterium sp. UMI-01]